MLDPALHCPGFQQNRPGLLFGPGDVPKDRNRKGGAAMICSAVETAVVPHWNGQLGFNVVCLRYLYLFICCSSFLKPSWPFQQTSYVLCSTVVPLCVVFCYSFDCYGAISKMCCFHSKPDPRISSDAEASSWGHRKVDGCFQLVDFREFHIIHIYIYIILYYIIYIYHISYIYIYIIIKIISYFIYIYI